MDCPRCKVEVEDINYHKKICMAQEENTKIGFTDEQLEQIALFQKHWYKYNQLLQQGIFEKEFTGRVVIDVLQGSVKNLQKITSYHFKITI